MPPKKSGKPKGKLTAYAAFVQICREEHKKKHPEEQLNFAEFSKKCGDKWKTMGPKEKKRFEELAEKDKQRYEKELAAMPAGSGSPKKRGKKQKKDPNAPKRAWSAFFFYCHEFRPIIKEKNPSFGVAEIAKQLGRQWEIVGDKSKYEAQAAKDKARYEKEMAAYKAGGGAAAGGAAKKASAPARAAANDDDDDDDDDEEEEEDASDDDDD